jgi:hypothetical protein
MLRKLMVASTVALAITALSTPAQAGVRVGIGIGIIIRTGLRRITIRRLTPRRPCMLRVIRLRPRHTRRSPRRRIAKARPRTARALRRTRNRRRPVRTISRPRAQIISQRLTSQPHISRRLLRDTARPVRRATRRPRVSLRSRRRCNPRQTSGSSRRHGNLPVRRCWWSATAGPLGFSRVRGATPAASPVRLLGDVSGQL